MTLISPFRNMSRARRKEAFFAYLFISPWLVGFFLWTLAPMVFSLILSFAKYNISQPPVFVGLANYKRAFAGDALFLQSLKVTFTYAALAIPLSLLFGFTVALLLNADIPGVSVWRTVYYLPSVISGVAVSMLWMLVFQPQFGVLNYLLRLVGIKGPEWLFSPTWVLPAFVIMSLWGIGGSMIIYLAGLQGIPEPIYEAAEIDGAGRMAKLLHITIPLMSPVIFYNLIMGIIGSFQVFTAGFLITSGGPQNSTLFYVLYTYRTGIQYFDMGYASVLAWVLFLLILALTIFVFKYAGRLVYYEDVGERA